MLEITDDYEEGNSWAEYLFRIQSGIRARDLANIGALLATIEIKGN
jgi:hypothetical protein